MARLAAPELTQTIALNVGSGNDYRETTDEVIWVNIDKGDCRVDQEWDLEALPYPFPGDRFDYIYACQVLEHISKEKFPDVIRELYRISKSGATWDIIVPHGFSDNFITDPTHKMPFSTRTFDYFCESTELRENGIIYGWGDICLAHINSPTIDGVQSIHFKLRVVK